MRWSGLEYLKVLQWRMAFEVADVNEMIAEWDAAFNVWHEGGPRTSPIM